MGIGNWIYHSVSSVFFLQSIQLFRPVFYSTSSYSREREPGRCSDVIHLTDFVGTKTKINQIMEQTFTCHFCFVCNTSFNELKNNKVIRLFHLHHVRIITLLTKLDF